MDPAQQKTVARIIAGIAGKSHINDREDMAQELWIHAIHLVERFDPDRGVPFRSYMVNMLRRRVIDVLRRNVRGRNNKQRLCRTTFTDLAADPDQRDSLHQQTVDPMSGEGMSQTEWADLGERVRSEPQTVQALYLYCSGYRMREIGDRFGISESRVSQILGSSSNESSARLRQLMFEKNPSLPRKTTSMQTSQAAPAPVFRPHPQTHPGMDPLEILVRYLASPDELLVQIQARIDRHRSEIALLEKALLLLHVGDQTVAARQRTRGGRLSEQIEALLANRRELSVHQAAQDLGLKEQSIRMAITKSKGRLVELDDQIRLAG